MTWDSRYRPLREGETIMPGDECLTDSHLGWQPATHDIGGKAPDPNYTSHRMYRRLAGSNDNEPVLAEKYEDAQNLIRQLMEQPVIEDTLYGRLARFRSKLPWAYELWVRKHLPGTNC